MGILDTLDNLVKGSNLLLCGILLLVGAFVLSCCYKTFWGQWKDRTKEDEIYGKPTNHRSHLLKKTKGRKD